MESSSVWWPIRKYGEEVYIREGADKDAASTPSSHIYRYMSVSVDGICIDPYIEEGITNARVEPIRQPTSEGPLTALSAPTNTDSSKGCRVLHQVRLPRREKELPWLSILLSLVLLCSVLARIWVGSATSEGECHSGREEGSSTNFYKIVPPQNPKTPCVSEVR